MDRAVALAGLLIAGAGVLLQFALTVPASMAAGRGFIATLVFFFTFFTILTNILVVAVYASHLSGRGTGIAGWLATPRATAGTAVAIAVVGIVYATVLARLWQPQGLFWLADATLHYVTPSLFVIWWLGFGREGATGWRDMPWWLIYPLAYLFVALARGWFSGEYPYPFLDLSANGVPGVAAAATGILALFLALSVVAVVADRFLPARRR